MNMSKVTIRNISKRFGDTVVLDDLSLDIESGSFLSLLGPSGCGKTTTLRLIAGLERCDSGEIFIDEKNITHLPTSQRNVGVVFQSLALFPHMTVERNIGFGLKMRGLPQAEIGSRVTRALDMVQLGGYGGRYPRQLSGGQQQRVALARALVYEPAVLLADEPFAALDRKLREAMQIELRELVRKIGITTVFVTHDQEEAIVMSDRVVVMRSGITEQIGTPADIFDKPSSQFVADFVGVKNILDGTVLETLGENKILVGFMGVRQTISIVAPLKAAKGDGVKIAIRPHRLRLHRLGGAGFTGKLFGNIISRTFRGESIMYVVQIASEKLSVEVKTPEGSQFIEGESVAIDWDDAAVHALA
jgi:spermidine/putrescine ABC transporter ATP-binding subunit